MSVTFLTNEDKEVIDENIDALEERLAIMEEKIENGVAAELPSAEEASF